MLKVGNLRIGKWGICLIRPQKQMAVGTGSLSFVKAVAAEQGGIDTSRPARPARLRTELGYVANPVFDEDLYWDDESY